MIALDKEVNTPLYVPDYMASSIEKIDFKLLAEKGIEYIAFDADSTLVPYRGIELAKSTRAYMRRHKKLFKGWCIASNRITNDLQPIADALGVDVVRAGLRTRKPKRRFFRRVLRHFNAQPRQVAMIGDKLLADVWGGNRAGFTTVWVEHLGRDSLTDRLTKLRRIEKRFLKRYI